MPKNSTRSPANWRKLASPWTHGNYPINPTGSTSERRTCRPSSPSSTDSTTNHLTKNNLWHYEQVTDLQNDCDNRNSIGDLCSHRTGTNVLQRDSDHYHPESVLPERRHHLHHRHQDYRNVRRNQKTLLIKNIYLFTFKTLSSSLEGLSLLGRNASEAIFRPKSESMARDHMSDVVANRSEP